MKNVLLYILVSLFFNSCIKDEANKAQVTDIEKKNIEFFVEKNFSQNGVEIIAVDYLQKNIITKDNFEAIKSGLTSLKPLASVLFNSSQPIDSILYFYNTFLEIENKDIMQDKIGAVFLVKILAKDTKNKEDWIIAPIVLNNRFNIPARIENLLTD